MPGIMDRDAGGRGVDDPTPLTTAALGREVSNLKEMVTREIESLKETIVTRFGGMDEATKLLRERQEKVPSETDKAIRQLREWIEEKFASISTQFKLIEERRGEQKKDTKDAVDAALTAQKESGAEQNKSNAAANSKMEASFTKQIEQLGDLIRSQNKSADEKNDDMKERMGAMEGRILGGDRTQHHGEVSNQAWIAIAVAAIAALALMYNVIRPSQPEQGHLEIQPPVTVQPAK
jgi:hypothetical protein